MKIRRKKFRRISFKSHLWDSFWQKIPISFDSNERIHRFQNCSQIKSYIKVGKHNTPQNCEIARMKYFGKKKNLIFFGIMNITFEALHFTNVFEISLTTEDIFWCLIQTRDGYPKWNFGWNQLLRRLISLSHLYPDLGLNW